MSTKTPYWAGARARRGIESMRLALRRRSARGLNPAVVAFAVGTPTRQDQVCLVDHHYGADVVLVRRLGRRGMRRAGRRCYRHLIDEARGVEHAGLVGLDRGVR